jgi:nucleoside-diphosphate-sugar epimerase
MELRNQKVLVTGASGFIGGHVARRLLEEKGAAVRGLVRNPAKARELEKLGVEVVPGDLADTASLERAVQGCSVVIHAAAQVSSVPNRATFEQSNVAGTRNLLRAAAAARVSRFVHLSSIAVFGLAAAGEVTDRSPRGHSGDPYCDTKFDAEEEVFRAQREGRLPVTILRPSAVYGPGSTHWSIIPVKRIKKGKMLLFDGGRGMLNYVYISNLVDAVLLAAQDDRAVGEAFIVNDGATTWREFFGALARMAGKNSIRSVPLWLGKLWVHYRNLVAAVRGESFRVQPNALGFLVATAVYRQTHIEEKLAYRSRVGLEEGLRRTGAWFHEVGLL